MTGEGIYLIQEDGALLELTEQPYESEELLQRQVVEVLAEDLGPSLRWATATTTRATRGASE